MEELSINSQIHCCIQYCAQHAKEGIVSELGCGVSMCWTQTQFAIMNGFFLSTSVVDKQDLDRRLDEIKTYVNKMKPSFPWVLIIEPEWLPPDLRERVQVICSEAGFVFEAGDTCMQTKALLPPVRTLPTVEIKYATTQQDVYDAALLNTEAFNNEPSVAKDMVDKHAFITDFDMQFCCLVLLDGKPVATATTYILEQCLYVAFVATSAQHRKRSYAEVAMRASIERALEKMSQTEYGIILHATEMGQPVYKRMGFKHISHFDIFVYEPSVSA